MKISRPGPKPVSGLDRSVGISTAWEGSADSQPLGQTGASDQAQLSSLSSYLASALGGSPAHVAKISELGAAVSSHWYQVDPYVVSGSIIQHSIEFGVASYLAVIG